ncbi:polysaccharide deacetylase family protein [Wenxinia marina]|uniref:Chitooligosaccharide deacetylase n=1 Tax=Wenxinia marina DSM 24838 TaxID=1123501 RepID=A0A0D0QF15_9RHOB|nr:polysaccharide deacetylase family protein [Wenxinia marina]KIQ70922.1 putative xylanase/chitin deacetylase [Wenxinia marina DSM 24838]GGL56275.1 glycosyl transferase [Wenxinia marina]
MIQREITLCLHGIGLPPPHVDHVENHYWCDEDVFHTILDGVAIAQSTGTVRVRLTFDDGNLSDLTRAAPALQERGLSAVFFVCTGRLRRGGPYLGEADLAALEAMGMEIGCHGRDHVRLRDVSDRVLREETAGAKVALEHALGHPVAEYVLPFGNYDHRVLHALGGFCRIHTTDARAGRPGERVVNRYCYSRAWDTDALTRILSEHPRRLRSARTWARLALKRNRPGRRASRRSQT